MIRITRNQSIFISVAIIGAFFGAVALFSNPSSQSTTALSKGSETPFVIPTMPAQNSQPGATGQSGSTGNEVSSQFMLENFHRSEVKNGKTVWEITAKRGHYMPESQRAQVEEADVVMFRPKGEKINLKTDHALLSLKGGELSRADANGTVIIVYNDTVTLETESAIYDKEAEHAESTAPVKIHNDRIEITGKKLAVNMDTKVATITGDVRTYIAPRSKS